MLAQDIPTDGSGTGGGVTVTALPRGSAVGRLTYDPSSPLADAKGYVRMPDIDMGEQMGNLIMAERAFQANANVIERAKQTYQDAIAIGKSR